MHSGGEFERICAINDISELLTNLNRTVDRAEAHPRANWSELGANIDANAFAESAGALIDVLMAANAEGSSASHRTSHGWISTLAGAAVSESYVVAYIASPQGTGLRQCLIGGRFLDRFALHGSAWRLTRRDYVLDWNANWTCGTNPLSPAASLDHAVPRGGRGSADAGRALLTLATAHLEGRGGCCVSADLDEAVDKMSSKLEIHELLMAYARGMDRADPELLASIFLPESTVVSGVVNGSGPRFAKEITEYLRSNLVRCFHSIANEWVDVKGDRAIGEAYVIATMTADGDDTIGGGRYINEFERRDGIWKIKTHVFVSDWSITQPTTYQSGGIYRGMLRGCFGAADPVYAHWKSAAQRP
jgi:hypothetical protein